MPEKTIPITKVQIGHIVGPAGATIKSIQQESGANVEIDNAGPAVKITADEQSQVDAAEAAVKKIVANQENPDYEGPEGARLRKEANELGDKRGKLYDEATEKRNAGDHETANKLAAEAKQAGEDMQARNREAAAAIAKYNNEDKGKGEDYFDMHGLREEEAIEMLKERTAKLEAKPADTVTDFEVIPGAGHHSAPGAQKLKGATEAFFNEKGYSYENASAGSIIVKVPGGGAAAAADEYPTEDPVPSAAAADEYPTEDPEIATRDVAALTADAPGDEYPTEDPAPATRDIDALAADSPGDEYPTEDPAPTSRGVDAPGDEYPTEDPAPGDEYPTEDNVQSRGGAAQVAEEAAAAKQAEDEEEAAPGSKVFVAMPPEVRERRSMRRSRSREPNYASRATTGEGAAATAARDEDDEDADGRPSSRVYVRMPNEVRERRSRSREARSGRPSVAPSMVARSAPAETAAAANAAAPAAAKAVDGDDDMYPTEDAAPVAAAPAAANEENEDAPVDAAPRGATEPAAADDDTYPTEEPQAAQARDAPSAAEGAEAVAEENHEPAAAAAATEEEPEPSFEELDTPKESKKDGSTKGGSKRDGSEGSGSDKGEEKKDEKKKKDKGGCCATM